MTVMTSSHVASELERIRIEVLLLRAAKVQNDLKKLSGSGDNISAISKEEIKQIADQLSALEQRARDLSESLESAQQDPLVLADPPAPAARPFAAKPLLLVSEVSDGLTLEDAMAKAARKMAG